MLAVLFSILLICVIVSSEIRVKRYRNRLRVLQDTFLKEESILKQKLDEVYSKIRQMQKLQKPKFN
jgi:hypothetical protein